MPAPPAAAASDHAYQQSIAKGLDDAYATAFQAPWSFHSGRDRMVIFSDLHKGARNAADDFRGCERAYNAALAYYYGLGFSLVELGDVEELWEERPVKVIEKYQRTLGLSAAFHADPARRGTRYLRVWGNHDDHWNRPDQVEKLLWPIYCADPGTPRLQVHGAVRVPVLDEGGEHMGELFLAHGHQGTFESDKATWISRIAVRYVWRPFQRLTKLSLNTPATDWSLRQKHNIAMHRWVSNHSDKQLLFIAGHTHRPVFLSRTREDALLDELKDAELALAQAPGDELCLSRVAEVTADLEWARAQNVQEASREGTAEKARVCYFNSGCAAYRDGDITGIELSDGEIRLVRWPTDDQAPRPKTLASMALASVFGVAIAGR